MLDKSTSRKGFLKTTSLAAAGIVATLFGARQLKPAQASKNAKAPKRSTGIAVNVEPRAIARKGV